MSHKLFAVAGVTGRTGRVAADTLLAAGHRVRVIVRDADKGAEWAARGAEVALADVTDAGALTAALTGADGAWLLVPPNFASGELRRGQAAVGASIAEAVRASKLPHAVLLSSVAAQLPSGTGPIAGLHPLERALTGLPSTGTSLLRAGYFMENLQGNLGALEHGLLPVFMPPDLPIDMVATRDIGRQAASLLVEGPPAAGTARIVELGGPPVTPNDVAQALSRILGRTITVQSAPTAVMAGALQGFGIPADMAAAYQEMTEAMVEGRIAFEGGHRRVFGVTDVGTFLRGVLGA
jgi:uncharacterized protein YbjT (DUF2867 family)